MQVDAEHLFWFCFSMGDVIKLPLVIIFSFIMLFYILGLSFFAGIGVFLVGSLINLFIGIKIEKVYKDGLSKKDKRMNHTKEALSNVKTLKLYSWTKDFESEIKERRG